MRIHMAQQLYPTYKQSVAWKRLYEIAVSQCSYIAFSGFPLPLRWVSSISDLYNTKQMMLNKTPLSFQIILCKYFEWIGLHFCYTFKMFLYSTIILKWK